VNKKEKQEIKTAILDVYGNLALNADLNQLQKEALSAALSDLTKRVEAK
jgi:hypothetical protein